MVDWALARQIARFVAGAEPVPELGADMRALTLEVEGPVAGYTGMRPETPLPAGETVDRRAFVDSNVDVVAELLTPVTDRLGSRMDASRPLAGPLRGVAGAALAAEVGLVMGYMSQRVLGQYEISLLGPQAPARLLYVAPNLERAIGEMGVAREGFLRWIALHELTHAFEFAAVPWLRDHLGGLVREYLESVELRVGVGRGAATALGGFADVAKVVETFREGGLAALVQSPRQRGIMERIQAAMAVVEGYSEHVMDVVGERVVPSYAGLREAMDRRRRDRSAPERALQRLLGFDMKLRQYELGKRFCDDVAARDGIEGLNRVWSSPRALPSLAELRTPGAWTARLDTGPALPAGDRGSASRA